ncbi:transporter [uncultured Sphingomonas sp.]|uniref:transporter n=1 Tax=uncultured Sphingomonas sp. TaxID=158754 RepID=UPI0025D69567|nr:transporter [uncultured Sphingomonas sp.]
MMMGQRLCTVAAAVAAFGWATGAASPASAQAIDAGDYVPAPSGTHLGLVYQQFAHSGSLYANGRKVDDKAELDVAVTIFRYVGFTKVAGMTLDYQVLQPFGHIAAGGSTAALGKTTGFGDTILVSTLWVHNDPANKSYLGITPYLFIPTGEYDRTKALNLGENRWKGSLQVVYSKGFGDHFVAELGGDAMLFGKNSELGTAALRQKAQYRVQGFARYLIDPANEANVRLMYLNGGATSIDRIDQRNITRTLSVLGTYRHTFSPKWQLLTQVGTDLSVHNGFREGARVQLRLLKVF